jgi:NAD(P)-dependent dehydrogenase (short-subunit alcohol dehydrogenase family)
VRALAAAVRRRHRALHVLSLNAAALTWKRQATPAGHEIIFATNYLGHFLLTNLLLGSLRAGAPSRVIAVSGHPATLRPVRMDFDDLMLEKGFNPLSATARAGLAKALFMFELARRLEGSGVTANTFHPGLVRSRLTRGLPWVLRAPATVVMSLLPRQSRTGIYLATAPEVERITGKIFVRRKAVAFAPPWDAPAAASRLWAESERLVGVS